MRIPLFGEGKPKAIDDPVSQVKGGRCKAAWRQLGA